MAVAQRVLETAVSLRLSFLSFGGAPLFLLAACNKVANFSPTQLALNIFFLFFPVAEVTLSIALFPSMG